MALNIVNSAAKTSILSCLQELERIEGIIDLLGGTSNPVPFLTRYSIIKACGTIEYSFKTIISDHRYTEHSEQVQRFIDEKFRNSSMNPNYNNICKALGSFDEEWSKKFKSKVNGDVDKERLQDSLKSLNTARNDFAHGKSPTTSFKNVYDYFIDCIVIMEMMESSILELEAQSVTGAVTTDVNGNMVTQQVVIDAMQVGAANAPDSQSTAL